MIIGVSIILKQNGRYLFEIQKPSKWSRQSDGRIQIGMGCVGGRLEHAETPLQALTREVKEEIGCQVSLEKPKHPFLFDPSKRVQEIGLEALPKKSQFLWEEEQPGYIPGARVAVYLGSPTGQPIPGDLPAIIETEAQTLFEMKDRKLPLEEMLARGGVLQERVCVPRDALIYPVDTARILTEIHEIYPEVLALLLK